MIALVITKIIEETPDTKTFVFETTGGAAFTYQAGQFITVIINRNGKELRRSYSLSSSPAGDSYTAFTIKRVTNGEVSRYLLDTLIKGSTLLALEPNGRFLFDTNAGVQRDIFLLAAGSGITPVYSLLKQILRTSNENHVKLILQNRDEQNVIFHDSLHVLETEFAEQFTFLNYLSRPIDPHKPGRRLNNEILENLVPAHTRFDKHKSLFYICGPLSFMRMAEFTIRQAGYLPEQIRKEIFDVPKLPPPAFNIDERPRTIQLSRHATPKYISIKYPSSILDAAISHHINIPFSCKSGICGSCVVKCTAGQVKMKYNDVLTDQEVADGLVLTCVGYAVSDITLDL